MRILQICPRIPWPATDGGRVAMLQITRSLQLAGAAVDVLSLNPRRQEAPVEPARAAMAPAALDACAINTSNPIAAAWRSISMDLPLLVARFYSPRFVALLQRRLATERYDVIHLEGQFLLPYVRAIRAATSAPIVLRAQNVEHRVWEGLARGPLLGRLHAGLEAWEIAHLDDCDAIVAISREDAGAFGELGAQRPILVAPCGVDLTAHDPLPTGDPRRLYFIGSMLYRPNQQAVRWIARELWPRIRTFGVSMTIAGAAFPADLRSELEAEGIDVAADFESVRSFSAPFGVMLAPLFAGSGMRIKVLEAMALGKAVIANPLGVGGLEVTDGVDVMLAHDAASFAARVEQCLEHPELVSRIGSAARELALQRYSPEHIGRDLVGFYETLKAPRERGGSDPSSPHRHA